MLYLLLSFSFLVLPPQLDQGMLVIVSPSLVKRCKNHFHNLLCGASIILGNNGYVWISLQVSNDHQQPQMRFQTPAGTEGMASGGQEAGPISRETRETIARLRNCIQGCTSCVILATFTCGDHFQLYSMCSFCVCLSQVRELLKPDVVAEITEPAKNVPND